MFPLGFSVLLEDLGKFKKFGWFHAFRMHCNVCLLVKLRLVNVNIHSYIVASNYSQLTVQYY